MTTAPGLRTIAAHVAEVLRRIPAREHGARRPDRGPGHEPDGSRAARPTGPVRLTLAEAAHTGPGLVLAAPLRTVIPLPGFDHAAVDGYAVRLADLPPDTAITLDVVGAVRAGDGPDGIPGPLRPGQAVRIMTGAPVPTGADAVVPVESTSSGRFTAAEPGGQPPRPEGPVTVTRPTKDNIRRRGEDLDAGVALAERGAPLTPALVAAAAASGAAVLHVDPWQARPPRGPRVAVVSTGSELRPAGLALGPGDVVDSNSLMLAALVSAHGAVPVRVGAVPDSVASLTAALDSVADDVDLIVTTGGVSAGAWDVVRTVLTSPAGPVTSVDLTGVAMRPGRPQGLAAWRGTPWIALPGTPVAALVGANLFVRPALAALSGDTPRAGQRLPVQDPGHAAFGPARAPQRTAGHAVSASSGGHGTSGHWCGTPDLVRVVPAVVRAGVVAPAPGTSRGGHAMSALLGADALALVPAAGVGQDGLVEVVTL